MSSQKLGLLSKDPNGYKVIFERVFPHDVNTVWDAITNPKKLAIWFMDVELKLVPGSRMIIRFRDKDKTVTYGKVTRVEPGRLFEYIWENNDGPDELATWELFPEGPKTCRLVMTYSKFTDQYVKTVPAGWHVLLDQLAKVLDGRTTSFPESEVATEEQKILQAEYAKILKTL
jgi:uncharacterized protein YndB with AHSA1/START domain